MPSLHGEHVFGILGGGGYGFGLLAPTEGTYFRYARRYMLREGSRTQSLVAPACICIVSLPFPYRLALAEEHGNQRVEHHKQWVANKLDDYRLKFNRLPPEFEVYTGRTKNGAKIVRYSQTHYRWTGKGTLWERYAAGYEEEVKEVKDTDVCGFPNVPEATGTMYVAFRGRRGGMGDRFSCRPLEPNDSSLLYELPAFYYEVVRELPTLLAPIDRELIRRKEEYEARVAVRSKATESWREEYEREEKNALLAIFGG